VRALPFVPLLLSIAFVAPVSFDAISETDAGWHLALGRHVLEHGVPATNALTWLHRDQPWHATSWAYDVLGFLAFDSAGPFGVQLFHWLLVSVALAGAWLAARRLDPVRGPWLVPFLALALLPRLTERPHVATWVVLAFTWWLCLPAGSELGDPARFDRSFRRRVLCLPLVALGSNLHSGAAFAAGVLGIACVEAFVLGGRRVRELIVACLGVVALAANPGGVFNVWYVVEHLQVQDVIRLAEFLAPTPVRAPAFFVLLVVSIGLAWSVRREAPGSLLVSVVFAVLGMRAIRMVYDFELLAIPLLALVFRLEGRLRRVGFAGVAVFASIVVWGRAPMLWNSEIRFDFDRSQLPVGAAEYVRERGFDGPVFNAFRDGGYLELAVPKVSWLQDARVQAFPADFFLTQQSAEKSRQAWRSWIDGLGVDWVVATRVKERLGGFEALHGDPDWALVFWDATSEVWVRRGVERFAAIVARDEFTRFRPFGAVLKDVAASSFADMKAWTLELDRFEKSSPGDRTSSLVRCAVSARGGGFKSACEFAAGLDPSERWQQLVAKAASIPAVSP